MTEMVILILSHIVGTLCRVSPSGGGGGGVLGAILPPLPKKLAAPHAPPPPHCFDPKC